MSFSKFDRSQAAHKKLAARAFSRSKDLYSVSCLYHNKVYDFQDKYGLATSAEKKDIYSWAKTVNTNHKKRIKSN
jgi:hypothetical protein